MSFDCNNQRRNWSDEAAFVSNKVNCDSNTDYVGRTAPVGRWLVLSDDSEDSLLPVTAPGMYTILCRRGDRGDSQQRRDVGGRYLAKVVQHRPDVEVIVCGNGVDVLSYCERSQPADLGHGGIRKPQYTSLTCVADVYMFASADGVVREPASISAEARVRGKAREWHSPGIKDGSYVESSETSFRIVPVLVWMCKRASGARFGLSACGRDTTHTVGEPSAMGSPGNAP